MDFLHKLNCKYRRRGGFRACIFVFVLGALENIGFVANMSIMVLYFHHAMSFGISTSANMLTNFLGSTFLLTIVGGFISDTYLNRLHTCLIFGFLEIMGLLLVTIQAYSKNSQADSCKKSSCVKGGEAFMFYTSLCLLALGAGGVKGSIAALGADQFDRTDQEWARFVASYFNYYQFSATIGSLIGVTAVMDCTEQRLAMGFLHWLGSGVGWFCGSCTWKAFLFVPTVVIAAIQNRNLKVPEDPGMLHEIEENERDISEEKLLNTRQFRFLDKAAVLWDGVTQSRRACTVTQVEEVKKLIRMLPIISSTVIMNTCLAQLQTFSVLQGYLMEPHLATLNVPNPSIPVIPIIFMVILLPLYEFFFIPLARRLTGHPTGITQLQRVGVGLVLSVFSMGIAGLVEVKRRDQALTNPSKPISLFWLSFQYGIFGIADMFVMVGLMEFFYKEAPSGMRSLSTSFSLLSLSFGYFFSSMFVSIINAITQKATASKQGWLEAEDLNHNKLDYFYWFLAILSSLNFGIYLLWASWYR
ncbi:Major facilitator superfamily protein [Dorcoceras hygrometricum]|uniref:Major facilitator superfamily protein n=1 Tax=Dorcoceras hygrometricum TaxID=472368 RepID=A0A2Z7CC09_9LAMI|nr:Major facilitator superfamily protein [Dorcoceras hygrometricum]